MGLCHRGRMIFGEGFAPAASVAVADWIGPACDGAEWTVGALVPTAYPAVVRIRAPEPADEWWPAYREVFAAVAAVGARHTSTPERAWFAVWEGHGFVGGRRRIYGADPGDDAGREALAAQQAQLSAMDAERDAAVRAGLAQVPLICRPHRWYHLMSGSVAAVTSLRRPERDVWFRPDLFWPDDRRWFAATDVDFWSIYVGGDHELVSELREHVPTPTEIVTFDHPLESES